MHNVIVVPPVQYRNWRSRMSAGSPLAAAATSGRAGAARVARCSRRACAAVTAAVARQQPPQPLAEAARAEVRATPWRCAITRTRMMMSAVDPPLRSADPRPPRPYPFKLN